MGALVLAVLALFGLPIVLLFVVCGGVAIADELHRRRARRRGTPGVLLSLADARERKEHRWS